MLKIRDEIIYTQKEYELKRRKTGFEICRVSRGKANFIYHQLISDFATTNHQYIDNTQNK